MGSKNDEQLPAPEKIGAKLFAELVETKPKDSYRPNRLPSVDRSVHTEELIAELQKPALQT